MRAAARELFLATTSSPLPADPAAALVRRRNRSEKRAFPDLGGSVAGRVVREGDLLSAGSSSRWTRVVPVGVRIVVLGIGPVCVRVVSSA